MHGDCRENSDEDRRLEESSQNTKKILIVTINLGTLP